MGGELVAALRRSPAEVAATPYAAAIDALFARTTAGIRPGLERTTALLDGLGDPHRRVPCLHVAGTNGKGSTVATVAALLRTQGFRVGVYTSPHLVDFRERIIVGDQAIDEVDVLRFLDTQMPAIERLGATFFEVTTAMAFDHFVRAAADVAVIETGLGGRLDATNVVDPVVATVTSIARDHTELLGESLEEIAIEKAGIFKAGRPAVIGERDPAIRAVLTRAAHDAGASDVHVLDTEVGVEDVRLTGDGTTFRLIDRASGDEQPLRTPLLGRHQAENTALAWLTLRAARPPFTVPLGGVAAALAGVRIPGRFERHGRFIFDVAHNLAGTEALATTLQELAPPRPIVALFSAFRDKDWREMLASLSAVVDSVVLTTAPSAPAPRAWDLDEALAAARGVGFDASAIADFDEALRAAADRAATVLVTGSFHTVGDALIRLQLSPLAR